MTFCLCEIHQLYLYNKKVKQMTLIKSISGIRGTIGGAVGDNLTPVDAVKFASAYGSFLKILRFRFDKKFNFVE